MRRQTLAFREINSVCKGHVLLVRQLCQAGFTTKAHGSGYGLYHAATTLGVYRGTLNLADGPAGGLMVTLNLMRPLHARRELVGATHDQS